MQQEATQGLWAVGFICGKQPDGMTRAEEARRSMHSCCLCHGPAVWPAGHFPASVFPFNTPGKAPVYKTIAHKRVVTVRSGIVGSCAHFQAVLQKVYQGCATTFTPGLPSIFSSHCCWVWLWYRDPLFLRKKAARKASYFFSPSFPPLHIPLPKHSIPLNEFLRVIVAVRSA